MKATAKSVNQGRAAAEAQLQSFIGKFDSRNQALIISVRQVMRKRLPSACELVYDNYNFFVIGYSPTGRPSDAIFSIAADANGVNLAFLHGASLPDPRRILVGSGKQNRLLRVGSVEVLAQPAVKAVIEAAVNRSRAPFPSGTKGQLIIRSISARQRPRKKSPR